MVPNFNQTNQRLHHVTSTLLNKEPKFIPKQKQTIFKEITRDLLDRQNEYDKINKVYTSMNFNHKGNSVRKQSKFCMFKKAVREAKLKFLLKSSCNENSLTNHNQYSLQQKHSIAIIAQIFRNQKSTQSLRSSHKNELRNQWNLLLMLIITIPLICLLVIMNEFIGLNK